MGKISCKNSCLKFFVIFPQKILMVGGGGRKEPQQDAKHRDIFRDTLIAKKIMAKEKFEPTTYWLGNKKISSTSPGSNEGPTTLIDVTQL